MRAINKAIKIAGSQCELAKKSGVSQAAISKIASGKNSISPATAIKIEKAMDSMVTRQMLCPNFFNTT